MFLPSFGPRRWSFGTSLGYNGLEFGYARCGGIVQCFLVALLGVSGSHPLRVCFGIGEGRVESPWTCRSRIGVARDVCWSLLSRSCGWKKRNELFGFEFV